MSAAPDSPPPPPLLPPEATRASASGRWRATDAESVLELVGARAARVLGAMLYTLLVLLPLMLLSMAWGRSTRAEIGVVAGILVVVVALVLAFRRGHLRLAVAGLVTLLVVAALAAGLAFGSPRGVGSLALVGAITVGGIFLGRLAMIVTVGSGAAVLALVIALQNAGQLPAPDYRADAVTWLQNVIALVAIAANIWFARSILIDSLRRARDGEARLQAVFRSSPVALMVQEMPGRQMLMVNAAAERMFRIDASDVIGQVPGDRFWDDPADRRRFADELQRSVRAGPLHARLRRADGERFDAVVTAESRPVDNGTQSIIAIVDMSEEVRLREAQRASEAQLLEAARGVSAETGEAFFRRLVEHLARATGADRANVGELVDGGRRVRTVARFANGAPGSAVEYDLSHSPCEVVLQGEDVKVWTEGVGAAFPLDEPLVRAGLQGYIGAPLFGADGRPAGIMNVLSERPLQPSPQLDAVFRIFAARAQAELVRLQREREIVALNESLERRVRERTAEVEQANRELEAFSYSVSHDLRAPLRGIDGLAQLLQQRHAAALPPDAQAWIGRLREGTQRMGRLIDDLLQLSRAGRDALKPARVDVSLLARAVATELERGAPQRRVQWCIAEGLVVQADAGLLHIVLTNLIGNAFKYTGRVAEAQVHVEPAHAPPGFAGFAVRDNGAGFDMAAAGQLFEPFRRLHASSEFEGSGVGLATVRRIVERHGGQVRADAAVGEGARFEVLLPEPAAAA